MEVSVSGHPRGVFEPEFTGPGCHPLLLAIDSEGRFVAHVSLVHPDQRGEVMDAFRDLLDVVDPDARLTLVR